MALRPDSFCDYSAKRHMEEIAQEDTHKSLRFWYERAVNEQKAELRHYKKKIKAQAEAVNIIIEEDPSIEQRDGPEAIKA